MTGLGKRLYTSVSRWLLRGPLLAALRRLLPILRFRRLWVITRNADVCEVLERDADFKVSYGPRMDALIGPFVLGMEDAERHRRARGALDRADRRNEQDAHRADLGRIASGADETSEALLDDAGGTIDVVQGLSDPVVHRGIADYLGAEAPDAPTLLRWCRAIGWDIFLNPQRDADVARRAEAAAAELRRHVEVRIGERRRALYAGDAAATLLDRLVAGAGDDPETALDQSEVHGAVMGLILVWAVAVPRAAALTVDELLRRPELASAQAAARAGDEELLRRHVFEALRFEPLAPAVGRVCRGATLAGDRRRRDIPAGAIVVPVSGSAMMDPAAVPDPKRFRGDRDPAGYGLHFGRGAHACWGEAVATAQLTSIIGALLRRPALRRAGGPAGRLVLEGPFPSGLGVAYEP